MDTMEMYRRAQDGFDAVLAAVRQDQWGAPSACAEWTVRDVAGHVIWGQHQMRAWATGEDYAEMTGARGAPHPAAMAGDDPVATWRAAWESSVATLTPDTLARMTSITGIGAIPLAAVASPHRHSADAHASCSASSASSKSPTVRINAASIRARCSR